MMSIGNMPPLANAEGWSRILRASQRLRLICNMPPLSLPSMPPRGMQGTPPFCSQKNVHESDKSKHDARIKGPRSALSIRERYLHYSNKPSDKKKRET